MNTSNAVQVCLVEDDDIMGESLVDRFALEGFSCDWHKSAQSAACDLKEKRYDVVVSDIRLPDRDGDELFEKLQAEQLYVPPWIFITGYGTIERAIALMKLGATDYVTKPFDLDQLVAKLRAYIPSSPHDERLPTLGLSPGMRRVEDTLPRLATQSTTVLITGQSGVGKEVVAREIHRLDKLRAGKPFIAVNCGGIPENLLEAELFGHERGAFTGAMRLKRGLLEQATGGTLFLDEIGDMPLAMQVKLLRVLQERTVTRLGGGAVGRARARAALLLLLGLPGQVFLYQGEELGLEEVDLPDSARQDPIFFRSEGRLAGRDGCRVPMPWQRGRPHAGFSTVDPWLPVPAGWDSLAADVQAGNGESMLAHFRRALAARKRLGAGVSDRLEWARSPEGVLAYSRGRLAVACNFKARPVKLEAHGTLLLASDPLVSVRAERLNLPPNSAAWLTRRR